MSIRNYLDQRPMIGDRCYIDEQSTVIGNVTIADDVSIWPMVVIRGDVSYINIGSRSNIQDGSVLHVTCFSPFNDKDQPLNIGDDVTVGHNATLHACTIENASLIGMNAVVLDNAHIESHVFVAAGSVVPPGKRLQSGYLYKGNPVQQARPLKDQELEYLLFSSQHYVSLKNTYLSQGQKNTCIL